VPGAGEVCHLPTPGWPWGRQGVFSPAGRTLALADQEGSVQVYPDWARLLGDSAGASGRQGK
jgi:hypothetical protein